MVEGGRGTPSPAACSTLQFEHTVGWNSEAPSTKHFDTFTAAYKVR